MLARRPGEFSHGLSDGAPWLLLSFFFLVGAGCFLWLASWSLRMFQEIGLLFAFVGALGFPFSLWLLWEALACVLQHLAPRATVFAHDEALTPERPWRGWLSLRRRRRHARWLTVAIECARQPSDPDDPRTVLFEVPILSQRLEGQDLDVPLTAAVPWARVAAEDPHTIQWVLWVRLGMKRGPDATRRFEIRG